MLLLGSVAVFAASLLGRDVSAGQLLTNGDFEDGTAGWSVFGATVDAVDDPGPSETDHAARIELVGGTARVLQQVAIVPAARYQLRGSFLFNDATVSWVQLDLIWTRANGSQQSFTVQRLTERSPSYQTVLGDVTLPCDVTAGRVEVVVWGLPGGTVYADDLRLDLVAPATPCPTSTPVPTSTAPQTPPPTPQPTAASTPPPPTLPRNGLLLNGGFEVGEGGRPLAWSTHGGVLTQTTSPVRSGRFAGAFTSTSASTKWAYQVVPVEPAAWYQFDAYVLLPDPRTEAALLRVSWYASTDGSGQALASVDSTQTLTTYASSFRPLSTGPVMAPPGARSAQVRILLRPRSATSATIYIDDASFRSVAPPQAPPDQDAGGPTSSGDDQPPPQPTRISEISATMRPPQLARTPLRTPLPTPVLERGSEVLGARVEPDSSSTPWWPFLLFGLLVLGGGGAWAAWRYRRRRSSRTT